MTMKKILKQSREERALICFHEFISTDKTGHKIFGFCEGMADLSFYKGVTESRVSNNWEIQFWEVGGQRHVLELHKKLRQKKYNNKQVVFFIDRDLTEFVGAKLPKEENVYITDNYSIENDMVNRNTCERVLTEVLGFNRLSPGEIEAIQILFDEALSKFFDQMIPIMSWIIHWQKKKYRSQLSHIQMNDLFEIESGVLSSIAKPTGHKNVIDYIHKKCCVDVDTNYNSKVSEAEFCNDNKHKKFTRGKFVLWFLVEFCLSVHKDYPQILDREPIKPTPKNSVNLSQSTAVTLISSRFRAPDSLKKFLRNTVECYVNQQDVA